MIRGRREEGGSGYVHVSLDVAPRVRGGVVGDGDDGFNREKLNLDGALPGGRSGVVEMGHFAEDGHLGGDIDFLDPERELAVNAALLAERPAETEACRGQQAVPRHRGDFLDERVQVQERFDEIFAFGRGARVDGVENESGLGFFLRSLGWKSTCGGLGKRKDKTYAAMGGVVVDQGVEGEFGGEFILKGLEDVEIRDVVASAEDEIGVHDTAAVGEIGDLVGRGQHDAEVEAGPAQAPEELGVLGGGDGDDIARGRHQPHRNEGVDDQAVKPLVPSHSCPQSGAHHANAITGARGWKETRYQLECRTPATTIFTRESQKKNKERKENKLTNFFTGIVKRLYHVRKSDGTSDGQCIGFSIHLNGIEMT